MNTQDNKTFDDNSQPLEINSIQIPDEFVKLCTDWHNGVDSMMYAVFSTGNLTLGNRRPWNDDLDRPCTDKEWYVSLFFYLSCEVSRARKIAEKCKLDEAIEDREPLKEFETWLDETVEKLNKAFGLD